MLLGIGVTVALSRTTQSMWHWVPMLGGLALGLVAGGWAMHRLKRSRLAGIGAALEAQGFVADLAPNLQRAKTVFAPVRQVQPHLSRTEGAQHFVWLALQTPSLLVFEHTHFSGSGRTTAPHHCTRVAAASTAWPGAPWGVGPLAVCERAKWLSARVLRAPSSPRGCAPCWPARRAVRSGWWARGLSAAPTAVRSRPRRCAPCCCACTRCCKPVRQTGLIDLRRRCDGPIDERLIAGNVAQVMAQVRPFGVDVCSGPRSQGRLDGAKLQAYVNAVRGTHALENP